jgi:hypothetical protein
MLAGGATIVIDRSYLLNEAAADFVPALNCNKTKKTKLHPRYSNARDAMDSAGPNGVDPRCMALLPRPAPIRAPKALLV